MLHRALDSQGGVRVDPTRAVVDRLYTQVSCNAYLCGLLLRRERGAEIVTAYRTLLPGAPLPAWQGQVRQGVASLYGD